MKEISTLFVQEYTPSGFVSSNPDQPNAIWIKPSTGRIYKMNEDTGQWDALPVPLEITMDAELAAALAGKADSEHSHPIHGDINFTGTVSADGTQGLTGERTIGGWKITFKKGLLVGFQAV